MRKWLRKWLGIESDVASLRQYIQGVDSELNTNIDAETKELVRQIAQRPSRNDLTEIGNVWVAEGKSIRKEVQQSEERCYERMVAEYRKLDQRLLVLERKPRRKAAW